MVLSSRYFLGWRLGYILISGKGIMDHVADVADPVAFPWFEGLFVICWYICVDISPGQARSIL